MSVQIAAGRALRPRRGIANTRAKKTDDTRPEHYKRVRDTSPTSLGRLVERQ